MKSLILMAIALCLGFTSGTLYRNAARSQTSAREIGPQALWQPGMQTMQTIREKCASAQSFGDCFAYALAKDKDEPLLFKGDDFGHTDVRPAV